jgi:hypothetical protein
MKLRIKRISPSSLARTLSAIYFSIGCVASVLGLLGLGTGMNLSFNGWIKMSGLGGGFSLLMLLINPFLGAFVGYISGFLIALVYNFVSPYTEGVVIETEETRHSF